jgi:Leucine-rich repeat (LRR) protein
LWNVNFDKELPKLTFLNLSGNKIAVYPMPTSDWPYFIVSYVGIRRLTYLNLDAQTYNTLTTDVGLLHDPTFVEIVINTRGERKFIFKNVMYYTHYENVSMEGNFVLQHLYADGCGLNFEDEREFLEYFGHLKALRTLSLAHSQLDFVSSKLLKPFSNLTTLILKGNTITLLPEGVFDSLELLTYLDLSANKITVVS